MYDPVAVSCGRSGCSFVPIYRRYYINVPRYEKVLAVLFYFAARNLLPNSVRPYRVARYSDHRAVITIYFTCETRGIKLCNGRENVSRGGGGSVRERTSARAYTHESSEMQNWFYLATGHTLALSCR